MIGELAENRDVSLSPAADVVSVMQRFDQTQADELAVVGADGQVLGVVSKPSCASATPRNWTSASANDGRARRGHRLTPQRGRRD